MDKGICVESVVTRWIGGGRPMLCMVAWLLVVVSGLNAQAATGFRGPLKVGNTGRYLTYADGTPFYYVADTPWTLLSALTLADAKEYIDIRTGQGFTGLQMISTPWSFDNGADNWNFNGERGKGRNNANGDVPFFTTSGTEPADNGEVSFAHPNEAYWQHVDAVLNYMEQKGLVAYLIPLWASNFSSHFTKADHYTLGKFIGTRYREQKNVLWVLGGDERNVSLNKYQEMLRGLKDAGVTQLISMHPRSGRSSSDHMPTELDFSSVQIRNSVANMVALIEEDYNAGNVKPTFLCETWYEDSVDGGLWSLHKKGGSAAFRAHYWAARLHGGFGEGYGAWVIWLNQFSWREDINRAGAVEIATHMQNILKTVDWHNLAPDDAHAVLSNHSRVHTAFSSESKSAVTYFEANATVTLRPSVFGGAVKLTWYDPKTGAVKKTETIEGNDVSITTPNSADSVLVMTTASL